MKMLALKKLKACNIARKAMWINFVNKGIYTLNDGVSEVLDDFVDPSVTITTLAVESYDGSNLPSIRISYHGVVVLAASSTMATVFTGLYDISTFHDGTWTVHIDHLYKAAMKARKKALVNKRRKNPNFLDYNEL